MKEKTITTTIITACLLAISFGAQAGMLPAAPTEDSTATTVSTGSVSSTSTTSVSSLGFVDGPYTGLVTRVISYSFSSAGCRTQLQLTEGTVKASLSFETEVGTVLCQEIADLERDFRGYTSMPAVTIGGTLMGSRFGEPYLAVESIQLAPK